MKRKLSQELAALSLLVCLVSTQGCYDVDYPVGMATAADILPIHMHPRTDTDGATRGASATTVGLRMGS